MRRLLFLGAAILGGITACSLVTSLDGLAEPADTADGANGTDGGDTGSADAQGDTSTADGGTDASWCATHAPDATFCTSFDRTDLGDIPKMNDQNGMAIVESKNALSPPYSVLVTAAALTSGESAVYGGVDTPSAVSEITVELAVRIEKSSDGSSALQLLKLVTRTGPLDWETGLAIAATSRKLFLYHYNAKTDAYDEPYTARSQPLDVWTRVTFHLKLRASGPGTLDLDLDGTRVATGLSVPSPPAGSSIFGLTFGTVFVRAPHTGWTARFDDVALHAN